MLQTNLDPAYHSVVGMGELQKIYKQNRIAMFSEATSSILMIFFSFLAIYYVWKQYSITRVINAEIILIFLSAPLFMFLGVYPSLKLFSRRNDLAAVYKDGFVYLHNEEVARFRWEEITAIKALTTKVRALGIIPFGTAREYWIIKGSTELRLASTLNQIDELLTDIRKNAFPHLFNRLKNEFDSGREIDFGSITISKNNIQAKEKIYPWTEFAQVTVADGIVHFVVKKRNPVNDIHLSLQYIANLDVLVALSNEWIKQINSKGN